MIKICLLTISDTRTEENDMSGNFMREFFSGKRYEVACKEIVADEKTLIQKKIVYYVDDLKADIVLTTGGTGFSARDVTPEATKEICEKEVPGIAEFLRAQGLLQTQKSILSRGFSGIRRKTLIINLPGSLPAVQQALQSLEELFPHAVDMLHGKGH